MADTNLLTVQAEIPSGAKTPFHLYASKDTQALLGPLAGALPGWAGMDVMLISKQDALSSISHIIDRHQAKGDIPTALGLAFNDMARGLGYDRPISHRHNGESYITQTRMLESAAMATVAHMPSTRPLNTDDPMKTRGNLCVISVPDKLDASELAISSWTNMHGAEGTFDLSPMQILTFALAHETGHCGQPMRGSTTPEGISKYEAEADQHGLNILRQLMGGDTGQFRKTAQEFVDLRVLESVNNFDITHATTPALTIDGRTARLDALDADGVPQHRLDLHDGASPQTVGLAAVLAKVVDHVALGAATDTQDATMLLATDPDLMRESVQLLKAQGAFDKSSLQTAYVDQYLDAFSRHGQPSFDQSLQSILGTPKVAAPEARTTASVPSTQP